MSGSTSARRTGRRVAAAVLAATTAAAAGQGASANADPTGVSSFARAAAQDAVVPTFDGLPAMVLDAHRSGGLEARENSLSGVRSALGSGVVDVVDLDVRRLGDDALGVMHDETVDRVTTSTGTTSSYARETWQRLTLDIGAWLRPEPDPEPPPLLPELLERFGEDTVFTVEVKEGLIDEVARLLGNRGLTDSVLVNTNSPDVARAVHDLGLLAHLWRTKNQMRTDDPASWAPWLDVVDVDQRAPDADVARFVASGVPRVWAHTITTRAERDRVVHLGVDGVVTDDPRYLSEVTDRYPVTPTVVEVLRRPRRVQVSDRTTARVVVTSQSGPVIPEAGVTVSSRRVTGRAVGRRGARPRTLLLSAARGMRGRTRVHFLVRAGTATERRWTDGEATVRLRVTGEDLQLVPLMRTVGRRLEIGVRLRDSAAVGYAGPRAEQGGPFPTVAALASAGLRLRVLHGGEVVHRDSRAGADTGTPRDGRGVVTFAPWTAPTRGTYTVRIAQRGPVYRHVVATGSLRLR